MKNKEVMKINQIDPGNQSQINQLASLYANVFAGPPWNEASKCVSTDTFYGSDYPAGSACPDCQSPLQEAYPRAETVAYILGEMGKDNPIGLLAYINNELAGFSWGYQTKAESVANSKWKTPKMQQAVKELLTRYGVTDKLFYGSETGVDPAFQGKGIGKKLVVTRLSQILRTGENFVLVRTNVSSPMYGICRSIEGFNQILGPKADKPLFSKKWQSNYRFINMIDQENVDRVLFLYDEKRLKARRSSPTPGEMMSAGW